MSVITMERGDEEGTWLVRDVVSGIEAVVPASVVAQASAAAHEEDRDMVIGRHPYFGWVYRDFEDFAGRSELSEQMLVQDGISEFLR